MSATARSPDPAFGVVLEGCRASHGRLLETVASLSSLDVGRPSLLPEWRVGHVLTHLARNADSHTRMLEAALRGEHVEQYAGGHEQRAADIESGAGRDGTEILEDVRQSTTRLEQAWATMTPEAWDGHGLSLGRPWPCRQIVFHRWREVELHHVDLGCGYGPADWPEDYVAVELPIALAHLPARVDADGARALFGWLVGRREALGETPLAAWQAGSYGAGSPFSGGGGSR